MDMRRCTVSEIAELCQKYHGYGSAGKVASYAWGVFESDQIVAGYIWQPPPPGASKSVCPEAPYGVLALSRMVAVPKDQRNLKHVSKPLKIQMKRLIDRTRWPVLITYSDEGQGHNGYVYQCSGWERTGRKKVKFYKSDTGVRRSRYSNGKSVADRLLDGGYTWIQRWEHWACPRNYAQDYMASNGWVRTPTGGTYSSGNPAFKWEKLAL